MRWRAGPDLSPALEENVNTRTLLLSVAVCLSGAAVCCAQDPNLGTWKVNEAKSQLPAGGNKITTSVYAADGENMKVTQDATDKDGNPVHMEWTGKFDGKDYPVTGSPAIDTRSYKKDGDRGLTITNKKDGKVITTAHSVISADGKTRTVHVTQIDSTGKKHTGTAVYDKE